MRHCKEGIFETAERVKEVVGQVSNIVVFERETFEVILPEMRVERAVLLKLKDYFDERSVSLVKVKTEDGLSVLIISEMMNYQAHTPL